MKSSTCSTLCLAIGFMLQSITSSGALGADNPFLGNWALTIPGDRAGWLGIEDNDGTLSGSILWGGGSVVPVSTVRVDGDTLVVTRVREIRRRGASRPIVETETIKATLDGNRMALSTERTRADGKVLGSAEFTGKRIPPPPATPDLSKVKYGDPIVLFNGKDMSGWTIMNPSAPNGWSVRDGILSNVAKQEPGKRISYANICTEAHCGPTNFGQGHSIYREIIRASTIGISSSARWLVTEASAIVTSQRRYPRSS